MSENIIIADADYVDSVAFNLIVNFERMIGRAIPKADLSQWAVCVAVCSVATWWSPGCAAITWLWATATGGSMPAAMAVPTRPRRTRKVISNRDRARRMEGMIRRRWGWFRRAAIFRWMDSQVAM